MKLLFFDNIPWIAAVMYREISLIIVNRNKMKNSYEKAIYSYHTEIDVWIFRWHTNIRIMDNTGWRLTVRQATLISILQAAPALAGLIQYR